MSMLKQLGLLVALGCVSACGSEAKPPPAAPSGAETAPPVAAVPVQPSAEKPDDDATKGQLLQVYGC